MPHRMQTGRQLRGTWPPERACPASTHLLHTGDDGDEGFMWHSFSEGFKLPWRGNRFECLRHGL